MANSTLTAQMSRNVENSEVIDQEEVDQVLAALRTLKNQITNPVVKECLEAVRSDIAHLADAGELPDDDEDEDDEDEDDEDFDDEDEDDEDEGFDDEDDEDEDEDDDLDDED